jgi:signal transduction histidine kinase
MEITDTGAGIDADKLTTVWLPFVRGAAVGTLPGMGLGLATVKRLVEAHAGSVSVRSEVGRGSTFSLKLPLRCAEAGSSIRRNAAKHACKPATT